MDNSDSSDKPQIEDIWKDITPLDIFDEKCNVFNIKYNKEYKNIMNIFRAVVTNKEYSERVYQLTNKVIELNPSNYMGWYIRRLCIDNVSTIDLKNELEWLDSIMVENQKNYQIWMHRKIIIDKLNDGTHERNILNLIFEEDSKNFHAWTHKIWVIRRFDDIEGEFDIIEKMLKDDIKNNSVWNFRFFLVEYTKLKKNSNNNDIKDIINSEIEYAIDKIKLCPNNESAYSYLRGFLNKYHFNYADFPNIKISLLELNNNTEICFCLGMLLDIYEQEKNKDECFKIVDNLIELDFIRKKYWKWRKVIITQNIV